MPIFNLAVCVAAAILGQGPQKPDQRELTAALQQAVKYAASFYNISFTAAVTWRDDIFNETAPNSYRHAAAALQTTSAAAAFGRNDWTVSGSMVTTMSLIPGGSLTKAYTSTVRVNPGPSSSSSLSFPNNADGPD